MSRQRLGDVDLRMHERQAERIGEPEGIPVALLPMRVEQDVPRLLGDGGRLGERRLQLPGGRVVLRLEQPLVHDCRKVLVVQPDRVEPAVPALERVEQAGRLGPVAVLAHQVMQVALTGHEVDDRGGTCRPADGIYAYYR
jgi:hypothetical protein